MLPLRKHFCAKNSILRNQAQKSFREKFDYTVFSRKDFVFSLNIVFLRSFVFKAKNFVQIILHKYVQNLLRVTRNNSEYCAKVVPRHVQMMRKS